VPKGKIHNKKRKTEGGRQAAFKAVCEHLSSVLFKARLAMFDWGAVKAYIGQSSR
jgi:hypothetical protein